MAVQDTVWDGAWCGRHKTTIQTTGTFRSIAAFTPPPSRSCHSAGPSLLSPAHHRLDTLHANGWTPLGKRTTVTHSPTRDLPERVSSLPARSTKLYHRLLPSPVTRLTQSQRNGIYLAEFDHGRLHPQFLVVAGSDGERGWKYRGRG